MKAIFVVFSVIAAIFAGSMSTKAVTNTAPVITIASIQSNYLSVDANVQAAAVDFTAAVNSNGVQTLTLSNISLALTTLSNISLEITNATIQTALSNKYKALSRTVLLRNIATEKLLMHASNAVSAVAGFTQSSDDKATLITFAKARSILAQLGVAGGSAATTSLLLGKPLLANGVPAGAGFYAPKGIARFLVNFGSCADTTATITIQNNSPFADAINTNTIKYVLKTVNHTDVGYLEFTTGTDTGSGTVTVVACGVTNTIQIYNYGTAPKPTPAEFPKNLPGGTYSLTYSATGLVTISAVTLDSITAANGSALYASLENVYSAFAKGLHTAACHATLSSTPFTTNTFSLTFDLTCSSHGHSVSEAITYTLTKQ